MLAVGASVWTAQADAVGGSSPKATASPTPGSDVERVAETIAHASDAGARGVNITIDDGPDPAWTPRVLDLLREYGVKATFCVTGTQAQATRPREGRGRGRAPAMRPHGVARHRHGQEVRGVPVAEILDAERMITKASGGVRPMYYRAPGGASPPTAASWPPHRGMRPLGWNVDTKDFERPGADAIVETVQRELLEAERSSSTARRRPLPDRRSPAPRPPLAPGAGLLLRFPGALSPRSVLGGSSGQFGVAVPVVGPVRAPAVPHRLVVRA